MSNKNNSNLSTTSILSAALLLTGILASAISTTQMTGAYATSENKIDKYERD